VEESRVGVDVFLVADHREIASPPSLVTAGQVVHITCPQCASQKAVVAATHFSTQMCFCPGCEHVWDCETPMVAAQRRSTVGSSSGCWASLRSPSAHEGVPQTDLPLITRLSPLLLRVTEWWRTASRHRPWKTA